MSFAGLLLACGSLLLPSCPAPQEPETTPPVPTAAQGVMAAEETTSAPSFRLDRRNWREWFMHVYPVRDELMWQDYGWTQQVGLGAASAAARDKAMVLWLDQGHPLGAASPAGRALRAHWVGGSFTTVMEKLIPVADDLRRVARAEDPEGRFVQALLAQVEDASDGVVLIAAADGSVLASCTQAVDTATLLATLREGLAAYESLDPATRRTLPEGGVASAGRIEGRFPVDGLAFEVFLRDLPPAVGEGEVAPGPDHPASPTWSRDYLWFSREEMTRFLPDPSSSRLSSSGPIPDELAARLAGLALHDHLHGSGTPVPPEAIQGASLRLRTQASTRTHRHYLIEGEVSWQVGEGEAAYGMEIKLMGKAQWAKEAGEFSLMEIVGEGWRHGEEPGSGRAGNDPGHALGFALRRVLSVDGWHRVPPAAFDQYPVGWPVAGDEDGAPR
ncbi:MAG: hypothetical protein ACPGQD_03250 [Planctomycetota bacterium]